MNSWIRRFAVTIVLIGLIACALNAQIAVRESVAEAVVPGGFSRWSGNTLVTYVGIENRTKSSAVAITQEVSGKSTPISVLKDFPEANKAQIADADATPDGGVVLSVLLVGPPAATGQRSKFKELILSYDASGALVKVWDVSPYSFDAVAADSNGNVYCFGERTDKLDSDSYPMLIEYSPNGRILRELVPRTLFPPSADPTGSNGEVGRIRLTVTSDGHIFLYVPTMGELLSMSSDGSGLKRIPLARILETKTEFSGAKTTEMEAMVVERDGSVLAHMLTSDGEQFRDHLVVINTGLGSADVAVSGRVPGSLLAVDGEGNLVFSHGTADAKRAIGHYARSSVISRSSNSPSIQPAH